MWCVRHTRRSSWANALQVASTDWTPNRDQYSNNMNTRHHLKGNTNTHTPFAALCISLYGLTRPMPAQGALGQILDRPLCRNTLDHVVVTLIAVHPPCNLLEYEPTVTYWQGSSVVSTLFHSPIDPSHTTHHALRLITFRHARSQPVALFLRSHRELKGFCSHRNRAR